MAGLQGITKVPPELIPWGITQEIWDEIESLPEDKLEDLLDQLGPDVENAVYAYYAGRPVPPPSGGGTTLTPSAPAGNSGKDIRDSYGNVAKWNPAKNNGQGGWDLPPSWGQPLAGGTGGTVSLPEDWIVTTDPSTGGLVRINKRTGEKVPLTGGPPSEDRPAPDGQDKITDPWGRNAYWNSNTGRYEYPPGFNQPPPDYESPVDKARRLAEQDRWERDFKYRQEQDTLAREQDERARIAQLAANPQNWIEYAIASGQPPRVQPWMLPMMPQQYGNLKVGDVIPGFEDWIGKPKPKPGDGTGGGAGGGESPPGVSPPGEGGAVPEPVAPFPAPPGEYPSPPLWTDPVTGGSFPQKPYVPPPPIDPGASGGQSPPGVSPPGMGGGTSNIPANADQYRQRFVDAAAAAFGDFLFTPDGAPLLEQIIRFASDPNAVTLIGDLVKQYAPDKYSDYANYLNSWKPKSPATPAPAPAPPPLPAPTPPITPVTPQPGTDDDTLTDSWGRKAYYNPATGGYDFPPDWQMPKQGGAQAMTLAPGGQMPPQVGPTMERNITYGPQPQPQNEWQNWTGQPTTQPAPTTPPTLLRPSRQLQARLSPSAMGQYRGYRQATEGMRPEDVSWELYNWAPPSGNAPRLSWR